MITKPHKKERVYFSLRILFSLLGLFFISLGIAGLSTVRSETMAAPITTLVTYVVVIVGYFWFIKIFMIGHLRGNGVEINESQFPAVFGMIQEISKIYGLKKIPSVFLIQSGGILNAYAARFSGKDYVAIYSDVFGILEQEPEVLKFILAHELAHVFRKHNQKRFWTLISFYVPFLGAAYSRACEHTCDAFANEVISEGSLKGLLLLAAGKNLYGKVNVAQYLKSFDKNNTAVVKFVGIFSSHPHLPKRIRYISAIES